MVAVSTLGGADPVVRHHAVEDPVELRVATAIRVGQAHHLSLHHGSDARPADRDPVPLAGSRRTYILARVARERPLRHEAVAERPGVAVREDPRLALPAGPVRGVQSVDVEVAAVLVLRDTLRVGAEPIDAGALVAEAAEDALPRSVVRPVRISLQHRQLSRPVGEM